MDQIDKHSAILFVSIVCLKVRVTMPRLPVAAETCGNEPINKRTQTIMQ